MVNVLLENAIQILTTLLLTLIGVLGAWLTAKIGKRAELTNIKLATDELFEVVSATVAELQQTTVEQLKNASADGKLSKEDIETLGNVLLKESMRKLSPAANNMIVSAGLDLNALIKAYGEQAVLSLKQ